jgi:group II intron reverse transcriptase/maturase
MTKTREKSISCIVPEKGGNASGGKAATASEQARQLGLFTGEDDSPQGADGQAARDGSRPARRAVHRPGNKKQRVMPAMTMEEVASYGNLKEAFKQVASNKGAPGPDGKSIEEIRMRFGEIISLLHEKLLDESYRVGMSRRVWIPKPGGKGERGLGIPNVIDRIVQQAVQQVLSPHYEPTFHGSSHGFRPGRSCHTAIEEAKSYLDDGYEWVVDMDLSKFFDRIHHQRLEARLEQRITDRRILRLIHRMLKAKVVMPDGVVVSTEEGAPQGGPLSPLLSNIVLDELDWELNRRGHRFVRYADDCNIYVRSERAGKRAKESISRFIVKRLRLKVNEEKSAVAKPEERHFVGFRLRRDPGSGEVEVKLSERSRKRIDAKIRELTPRTWGNSPKSCIQGLNRYLIGWIGFFRICTQDELQTLGTLDAHIRRRLRAIILKQWKRKRTIAKRLIKRGIRWKTAWGNVYRGRRSWWKLSHTPAVDRALPNAYFADQGLVFLTKKWEEYQARTIAFAPRQLSLPLG